MDADNKKTPLKDKIDILYKSALLIGMAYYTIKFLFEKGIFQYQSGMFSFMPLLPYHLHFEVTLVILAIVMLSFLGWIAHNFLTGKQAYDSYAVMVIQVIFIFLMCWGGTLYALSAPMPIIGVVALLLILLPLTVFITTVILRLIKMTLLGD